VRPRQICLFGAKLTVPSPDLKGLSADTAMILCIGVGGTAEQVCDLVVNREETLRLPG
jgi:hypothetical protein